MQTLESPGVFLASGQHITGGVARGAEARWGQLMRGQDMESILQRIFNQMHQKSDLWWFGKIILI